MGLSRRRIILIATVLVLLAAYAAAGFLAVPHFARQAAGDFVHTHYGRTLTIGDLRFNPFTLNLDVAQLALPDADGEPLVSFEHLHVGLELATLWRFAPSFGEIVLTRPYVRAVIRPGGELNLADLGKGFPPAPQPQKPSSPPRLYIGRLAVVDGAATFEDHTRPTPFRADLKPIAFELRDFSTTAATGDSYRLHAASPQGERLDWNGTVHLTPLASHGTFEIADLKARTLWSYLSGSVPFEIDAGVIALKGEYDLSSAAGPMAVGLDVHSLTVSGFGVKPQGAPKDYVTLAQLEVDGTHVDLGKRSVAVAKVELTGGDVEAWLGADGRINLLELLGSAPASAAAPPAASPAAASAALPAPASAPWNVSVPDIAVKGLRISAEDRQVSPAAALLLDPLNLHVGGFSLAPDATLEVELDTAVNGSGRIAAHAKVLPRSGEVTAHVEAQHLGLQVLQPLLAQYTSMTLLGGELGTRIDFERHADGYLGVKGDTQVENLATVDNELKKDFIKWRSLRIADVSYRSRPATLRIGSITAVDPYVRMIIAPDRSVNIKEMLTAPGAKPAAAAPGSPAVAAAPAPKSRKGKAAPAPAAPPPLTPFPTSIGTVKMVNGSADYTDLWIKPSFALGMQALNGSVTGLSSDPRSRAKLILDGKLASYSPLHIAGELNLLSAALYTDVTLSFKDLDLTIADPYSGYFVGYKIDKGKLSVDVSYKIEQRQLNAAQHFVVDQLELGDQVDSPEAMHLPLKLAVALLKDTNGVIDLPLPMSGSLDDPQFRIGPIIWKVFVNLIEKAVTAPFALLGHLFGGGEHMNVVEFAAGSDELGKAAQDQLASLEKALQQRPQLKLDVPIVASPGLDRTQLAHTQVEAALAARAAQGGKPGTAETVLADPARRFKLLVEQFHADLGKDAALPATALAAQAAKKKDPEAFTAANTDLEAALVAHAQIGDADLDKLGRARAGAIQNALLADGKVDPGRVFIVNAPAKPDTGDTVKVEMAIH